MTMKSIRFALTAVLMLIGASAQAAPTPPAVNIPSIGCPTGGQEDAPAPPDTMVSVHIDPNFALRLSLYSGSVLGPRGWQCQHYVTDAGYLTFVAPKLSGNLLEKERLAGPAIFVVSLDSGAFGRFDVAQIIARYFPKRLDFVRRVMAEGFLRRRDWVFHPYPHDIFLARSDRMFEVLTPPHRDGFGTGWLVPDSYSVRSRVLFFDGDEPGFFIVRAKLPPGMEGLAPVILNQPQP
jgi:hypothetical protein